MAKAKKPGKKKKYIPTCPKRQTLTLQQKLFCKYYTGEAKGNQTLAAKMSGYTPKNATVQANRLLKNANIQKYIAELTATLAEKIGVTAERIAREYMKTAFINIDEVISDEGTVKPVSLMSDQAKGAIQAIDINETIVNGEKVVYVKKVKLNNKIDALERLARMLNFDGVHKTSQTTPDGSELAPPAPPVIIYRDMPDFKKLEGTEE